MAASSNCRESQLRFSGTAAVISGMKGGTGVIIRLYNGDITPEA